MSSLSINKQNIIERGAKSKISHRFAYGCVQAGERTPCEHTPNVHVIDIFMVHKYWPILYSFPINVWYSNKTLTMSQKCYQYFFVDKNKPNL